MTILIHKIQNYFRIRKLKKEIKRLYISKFRLLYEKESKVLTDQEIDQYDLVFENIKSEIEHKQQLINQLNK